MCAREYAFAHMQAHQGCAAGHNLSCFVKCLICCKSVLCSSAFNSKSSTVLLTIGRPSSNTM